MALRGTALGCTHTAASAWFTGEGRKRWENRESSQMLLRGHIHCKEKSARARRPRTWAKPRFARLDSRGGCLHMVLAGRYCAPSFSKKTQMVSIPREKLGMWNFSLGAWGLSAGRAKPIITLGIFRPAWKT